MKHAILQTQQGLDSTPPDSHRRQFELVVQKTPNMVVITNQSREIEWVNPAFTEVCGWTLDEVKGRNPRSFMQGPGTSVADAMRLSALVRKGQSVKGFELLNYKKSGEPFWMSITIEPIRDEQGAVVQYLSVQSDVTDRRAKDSELKRKLSICQEGQRIAKLGTMEHELSSGRVTCSEEIFRILDTPIQAGDVAYESLMLCTHPDDLGAVRQRYEDAINAGGPYESEHRILSKSGRLKWVHLRGHLEGWDDGTPALCRMTVQDITERKQAERLSSELALQEQAAHDQIDALLRVSQHLRPTLHAISGLAEIVERAESSRLSDESRHHLDLLLESAHEARIVVDDILELARCHAGHVPLDIQPVALRPLVEDVVAELAGAAAAQGVTCRVVDGEFALSAAADRGKLSGILATLTRNAIKCSRADGVVEIVLSASGSGKVSVAIRDAGPGIEPGLLGRVFEPFRDIPGLAPAAQPGGQGLGLAIARCLARAMHGDLLARSELGAGSTFSVVLPQATAEPAMGGPLA